MISWANFFRKIAILASAALICLPGCAAHQAVQPAGSATAPGFKFVVFPVDNLTGAYAPTREFGKAWLRKLQEFEISFIADTTREKILTEHRLRSISGVDSVSAKAFREEAGAGAIFITSLEYYRDMYPPKLAVFARLVSTEDTPRILWMDSVGMAGDDTPGLLDLGLVRDYETLQELALERLADSFGNWLDEQRRHVAVDGVEGRFSPKLMYNESPMREAEKATVAVVPLYNASQRKRSGEIMQLHFIGQLLATGSVEPIEPGVVREKMLNSRMIMREGISARDVDILTYILGAEYVLSGTVFDYYDPQGGSGTPVVDFTTLLMRKSDRKVVFKSKSSNKGTDGVYFFDHGKQNNANVMAEGMARSVVRNVVRAK
ncbi:hypothetical protein [Citrifermentans bremense]|uniref:hypothetical protein n=1 Tax=Citrifermentans bremense TaxID=60035 RepID=UPI000400F8F7|nr:hypothetical protein [Citrifermentans bremense]